VALGVRDAGSGVSGGRRKDHASFNVETLFALI
jgi:hypothetical protein